MRVRQQNRDAAPRDTAFRASLLPPRDPPSLSEPTVGPKIPLVHSPPLHPRATVPLSSTLPKHTSLPRQVLQEESNPIRGVLVCCLHATLPNFSKSIMWMCKSFLGFRHGSFSSGSQPRALDTPNVCCAGCTNSLRTPSRNNLPQQHGEAASIRTAAPNRPGEPIWAAVPSLQHVLTSQATRCSLFPSSSSCQARCQ